MSFNDTTATTTINIGALIDTTATTTENVRSLLNGSVAWAGTVVQWFADATWTPAQITTLNTIFNTWGTVTGVTFQRRGVGCMATRGACATTHPAVDWNSSRVLRLVR